MTDDMFSRGQGRPAQQSGFETEQVPVVPAAVSAPAGRDAIDADISRGAGTVRRDVERGIDVDAEWLEFSAHPPMDPDGMVSPTSANPDGVDWRRAVAIGVAVVGVTVVAAMLARSEDNLETSASPIASAAPKATLPISTVAPTGTTSLVTVAVSTTTTTTTTTSSQTQSNVRSGQVVRPPRRQIPTRPNPNPNPRPGGVVRPTTTRATATTTTVGGTTTTATSQPPATTAPTTTLVPPGSVTVRYDKLPKPATVQPLGSIDGAGKRPAVAIGEGGVAMMTTGKSGSSLAVIGFDGRRRDIAIDGTPKLLAYGPGDVAYFGIAPDTAAAIALSGENEGKVVATWPADIAGTSDPRDAVYGHGPDGIVQRFRYPKAAAALTKYVDVNGEASKLASANGSVLRTTKSTAAYTTVVAEDGTTWNLGTVRAPEWKNNWPAGWSGSAPGDAPGAPTIGGPGVWWTHIGAAKGGPTSWVIAQLQAGGKATWWSVPSPWRVVASDLWGTVVVRPGEDGLQVGLLEFR